MNWHSSGGIFFLRRLTIHHRIIIFFFIITKCKILILTMYLRATVGLTHDGSVHTRFSMYKHVSEQGGTNRVSKSVWIESVFPPKNSCPPHLHTSDTLHAVSFDALLQLSKQEVNFCKFIIHSCVSHYVIRWVGWSLDHYLDLLFFFRCFVGRIK